MFRVVPPSTPTVRMPAPLGATSEPLNSPTLAEEVLLLPVTFWETASPKMVAVTRLLRSMVVRKCLRIRNKGSYQRCGCE
jgi:hypothetical protein